MTNSTLKSVVVLDPESQAYRPSAHNLSAAEAVNLAEQFSNENRTAKVLDQKDRHLVSDPAKCRACKKAGEAASGNDNTQAQTANPAAS
jgi:predicted Zn-ribbon and HTH transcriptional regulator